MKKIIEQIKDSLLKEYDYDSWQEFVDSQEMGNCQSIVAGIVHDFAGVEKVFGEIEVDSPSYSEDGEENYLFTHHWVKINGKSFDFSKGTLRGYIDWVDIYDVSVDGEEQRYKKISGK